MSQDLTYSAFESRYRDKHYIGSGGFAKVYKVFDHAKNHYVALKVSDVRPEWKKFTLKNEVELVNKLPFHRNIARYDACYRFNQGFVGEMDFAILKFYEYGNLEQFLEKEPITLEDKRIIIRGIIHGILFLHKNHIIHRDLKAQNILLHREDGVWTPKITDFGLSRRVQEDATITNSSIGISYSYAAPEQIQNRKIYKNVDLWSIGVIIYRIIADELPFVGTSTKGDKSTQSQLELSRKIINLELPEKLHTLPEPYQSIIKKCLVLNPAERIQNAGEILHLLDEHRSGNTTPPPPPIPIISPPLEELENKTVALNTPTPPSDKTQVVNPPPVKENRTPPIEATRRIVPPVVTNNPPPSIPSFEKGQDYATPKDNPTIFTNLPKSKEEIKRKPVIKPLVKKYEPKQETPPKKTWKKWLWAIPAIILIGFGTWFLVDYIGNTNKGYSKELKSLDKRIFDEYQNRNGNDTRQLRILTEQIETLANNSPKNYRPRYVLAKSYMYQTDFTKTTSQLGKAVKIAITNNDTANLLHDLKKDGKGVFKTKNTENTYYEIIHELEKHIKK